MQQSLLQTLVFILACLLTAIISINFLLRWNDRSGVFTKMQQKAKGLKHATVFRMGAMMAFAFVLITILTAIQPIFPNPYALYAITGIILGVVMAVDNIIFKGEELVAQRKKSKGKTDIIHRNNNIYKKSKKKRKNEKERTK